MILWPEKFREKLALKIKQHKIVVFYYNTSLINTPTRHLLICSHLLNIYSVPGLLLGEGNGTPLQSSCLENPSEWRSLVSCCPWGRKESDTTE